MAASFSTDIFVRPADDDTNGDGSVGDPYGDFQDMLGKEVMSTSGNTRINVQSGDSDGGTDEQVTAVLDFASNFTATTTPSIPNILQIRGYSSAAADGGIGGLDGQGGAYEIMTQSAFTDVQFLDMRLRNTGNVRMIRLGSRTLFINCEFDEGARVGSNENVQITSGNVIGCYFHNMGGRQITTNSGVIYRCRFSDKGETNKAAIACVLGGAGQVNDCTIHLDSTGGIGIRLANSAAINNSIFNDLAGTNEGILLLTTRGGNLIENNIIEGFNGTGGFAVDYGSGNNAISMGNSFFNNDNDEGNAASVSFTEGNEQLSVSGFVDAAAGDLTPVANASGLTKESSIPAIIGIK